MKKIFIDGRAGTTGLRIYERLAERPDIELLILSDEDRKNTGKRREMLNSCDIAFLCLPDDAARESVSLISNPDVAVLDTSTAHRTEPGWTYGFPELDPASADKVKSAKRIAVPGCHASGFIARVRPLVAAGLISPDLRLTCHSITGYSGGGKKMIAEYDDPNRPVLFDAPRQYGITQQHKHLKEMVKISGISTAPVFCPIVSDFYSGMEVTVPLFKEDLLNGATVADVREVFRKLYTGPIVTYAENASEGGLLAANAFSGKDTMQVTVEGNEDRILLIARYDNLGKGASGAAVECMNMVMGADPAEGLAI
ncbi:MAG: N-acetyl-gamma-glutamyl-phosphate reductase [Lentisphaeria bacterium]|nr:N-acetyl-gamma-glutamyl-phosphate reductase [Lentisphaeria bacterium]